jgi:hypothetical protein
VRGPVLFWNTHAGNLLRDFTADGHRGQPGQLPESIGSL